MIHTHITIVSLSLSLYIYIERYMDPHALYLRLICISHLTYYIIKKTARPGGPASDGPGILDIHLSLSLYTYIYIYINL